MPAGVLAVRAKLWGAGGGGGAPQADSAPAAGGGGGYTTATLRTTSWQTFALTVGQGGSPADTSQAFPGGGAGGTGFTDSTGGSAGGGMTAIWSDSALGTPLLIAGGGGGAGATTEASGAFDSPLGGGGGGATSGLDHTTTDINGGGATQDAGGVAASTVGSVCTTQASAGSTFSGGSGGGGMDPGSLGGGGGGGGYYGGGGGACRTSGGGVGSGGAGGGGSAFIAETAVNASTTAGDTSDDASVASYPGGTSDALYQTGIGTSVGGADGSAGEIVLEFDSNPVAPTPGNVTSTGVGTADQSPTITAPDGGSLRLLDGGTPVTSLTVSNEGSYSVNTDTNVITFTPLDGFKGDVTPVTFQLTNTSLQTGNATYAAHVDAPPGPTPSPLTSTGTGTAPQTATIIIPSGGSASLLDSSTETTSLTVPGEGSYSLDTGTGVITFTPDLGFSGDATAITYQIRDSYLTLASSTYTPHVNVPTGPSAPDLSSTGRAGAAQHQYVPVPLGGAVKLVDATIGLVGCLVVLGGHCGPHLVDSVDVPGKGTYSVDPATGVLTFTPLPNVTGSVTPVTYWVTDSYGQHAAGSYGVTVTPYGSAVASAPALVALATSGTAVPVTCKLTAGLIHRCAVTLTFRTATGVHTLGTGSVLVAGTGSSRPVIVPVRLNIVGRFLAALVGGATANVAITVSQTGNPTGLAARTMTRFVNAIVRVMPVHFDDSSANLRPGDVAYLNALRARLAGVRSVTCVGNTEPGTNALASWLLGYARAAATCNYLTRGTRIAKTLVSNGWTAPVASNATPQGRQLNRRTDITFRY